MWLTAAVVAAASPQAPRTHAARTQSAAPVVHYTIRPHDTLSDLAHRYLGEGHNWRNLGEKWHIAEPRHLPTGRTFTIPRSWLRWTSQKAQLVSMRGNVSVSAGLAPARAAQGAVLGEGANIVTGANSFATLTLSNGSRISLPSHSSVTILRLRKYAINEIIDYHFRVDRGMAETKDPPLKNSESEFVVRTPLALTAVRGTEFAVSYDAEQKQSGTAVFEGVVAFTANGSAQTRSVPQRFGVVAMPEGPPRKLALLPAPDLDAPGRPQADEIVTFDLRPLAGATAYHAQLARDAGFIDSFAEQTSASPHFEFADVPNGTLFVRIAAVGTGDLRGMRQSYSFTRHLASLRAQAEPTDDGYLFRWSGDGEGSRVYRLQIFRDNAGAAAVVDEVGLTGSEVAVRNLQPGAYTWRIGVTQTDAQGAIENWTTAERLTISKRGD